MFAIGKTFNKGKALEKVTTGCYQIWLRSDLKRHNALAYWFGPHGQIANKNDAIEEYLQHHFSESDIGIWPTIDGVTTDVPADWKMDGVTDPPICQRHPFHLVDTRSKTR